MGHSHDHGHLKNGKALFWAILINVLLSVVQVIGGLISGSLALLADALHNFSDAGALLVAYTAHRVSSLPANNELTYGYGRAQILGALINSVMLVMVGLFLIYESWQRFLSPSEVNGWIVIVVAALALVVDLATALLTHSGAKDSINMKAAFIHNVSDALASVVVIISGILILNFNIYWIDLIATCLISTYILYQSVELIKSCIRTLMQAVPKDLNLDLILSELKQIRGIKDIHNVHIWAIHEKLRSFEGHIVLNSDEPKEAQRVKAELKALLKSRFKINHSTLELEFPNEECQDL